MSGSVPHTLMLYFLSWSRTRLASGVRDKLASWLRRFKSNVMSLSLWFSKISLRTDNGMWEPEATIPWDCLVGTRTTKAIDTAGSMPTRVTWNWNQLSKNEKNCFLYLYDEISDCDFMFVPSYFRDHGFDLMKCPDHLKDWNSDGDSRLDATEHCEGEVGGHPEVHSVHLEVGKRTELLFQCRVVLKVEV